MLKKIKKSKRGLTFTTEKDEKIGTKFRYFIDKKKNQIIIEESINGGSTVSRKKSGKRYKALYDIRSKEVKELISNADYLEIDEAGSQIIVKIYQSVKKNYIAKKSNIVHLEDVLLKQTGQIILDKASGMSFGRPTLACDEYFSYLEKTFSANYVKREKKKLNTVYDVISLFSGAGMLDYAFKDPKFRFVFANDACLIDGKLKPEIAETYEYNMGHKMTIGDIREIDPKDVPACDLIIGGPCCQGYSGIVSSAERRYSEEAEKKRLLIDDYVRFVIDKQPKVFVIENVPELLSEKQGKYIREHVLNVLTNYEITATIVKDSEVGGYSVRRRAIVIGSRIGKIELPDVKFSTVKTVRDALSKVDATWFNYDEGSSAKEGTKILMSYVPEGGNFKDIPEEIAIKYRSSHTPFTKNTQSQNYRRLEWDKPSPTIACWRKACMMPPEGNRTLSVSEVAAIQGLPKEFHLFGGIGAKQQMLGNGVTQAMGRFVKKYVLDALDRYSKTTSFTDVSLI